MNNKVTTEIISALNPCNDRLENWIKNYSNFDGSIQDFLDLKEITHKDKLWVYFRLIPREFISPIAGDLAEQVLHIYERFNPDISILKMAIQVVKDSSILKPSIRVARDNKAQIAYIVANSAVNAAAASASAAAVVAAVHSHAAYGINAAGHTYAVVAAINAVDAYAAVTGRVGHEKLQIEFLKGWVVNIEMGE